MSEKIIAANEALNFLKANKNKLGIFGKDKKDIYCVDQIKLIDGWIVFCSRDLTLDLKYKEEHGE